MKVLPEDKKRTWLYAVVLIVAAGGIIFLFINLRGAPPAEPPLLPGQTGLLDSQGGSLLPYGNRIDLGVLEQESFKALRAPPLITVSPEELGKPDLFAP